MSVSKLYQLRDKIVVSDCYLSMDNIQQKLSIKTNNLRKLENHLNVINNVGYEKWLQQSKPNYLNKLLIKELKQ